MNYFLFKIILTSLLIGIATLAARRWGETVAGLIVGLPLKSGPTSIFFALEQGPAFAADAARATLLGLVATAAFFIGYTVGLRKFKGVAAFGTGLLAYLLAMSVLSSIAPSVGIAALMVVLTLIAALLILGTPDEEAIHIPPPWWDLPLRMLTAATLVTAITGAAQALGPKWSGLISPFPVFTCVMAIFSYSQGGPKAALRLMRGVATALFAFTAFFVVVALLVDNTTLLLAYGLATVTALGINGLSLTRILHKKRAEL